MSSFKLVCNLVILDAPSFGHKNTPNARGKGRIVSSFKLVVEQIDPDTNILYLANGFIVTMKL